MIVKETQSLEGELAPVATPTLVFELASCSSCINVTLVNQVNVIFGQLKLGHAGIIILALLGLRESITHDGNEHIEEDNHDEEC